jgi:hypothetical protein
MAATVAGVIEALRYTYSSPERVAYLYNDESVTHEILSKNTEREDGRGKLIQPLTVKIPSAFTGLNEGGTIPTPTDPDTAEATWDIVEYVGAYSTSWKLLDQATRSEAAFVKVTSWMTESLRRHMFRMLNADLIGTGVGALYSFPGADDNATHTAAEIPSVNPGMVIDIVDIGDYNTKHANSVTVSAVVPTTKAVTTSGAPSGTGAGDIAVIQDTVATGLSYHSHGLLGIIDDADPPTVKGDYGGIDRATAGNEFWESSVLANGGTNRPWSEDLMIQGFDNARVKGGSKIDCILSNQAIVRRYHAALSTERFMTMGFGDGGMSGGVGRKNVGTLGGQKKSDGKSVYNFGGVPWYVDPYFAANTIVAFNKGDFSIGVGKHAIPRPVDEWFDGVTFFKRGTATTFQVEFYYLMELLCRNPAGQVKWEDISES